MSFWSIFRANDSANRATHAGLRWPEDADEWQNYYNLRDDAYKANPYTIDEIKGLGLFRELDLDGKVIAETRRLTRDVQYVVNRDAEALAPEDLTYEVEDGAPANTDELVSGVWRRSGIDKNIGAWARMCGAMGMIAMEAVRTNETRPYDTRIVRYDPRHVEDMEFDPLTGDLTRLVISMPEYIGPATVTRDGTLDRDQPGRTYKRVLTAERVDVYRDGQWVEDESGEHGAGRVPAVVVPFLPYHEPGRGLWAAQGLDYALALVDSLLTQVQAVGNRHGNPLLVPKGVRLEPGTDVLRLGRILEGVPQGGDVTYTEASLTGLSTLLDAASQARENVRQTLPEFLFAEAGASASGSALNFRAASFVAKIRSVRKHWYRELADIIEIAIAMEQNRAYDPSVDLITIKAGPVLPVNVPVELESLLKAYEAGSILHVDLVKGMQRIGLAPRDAGPAEYSAMVMAEQAANDERLVAAVANANGAAVDANAPEFEVLDEEPET